MFTRDLPQRSLICQNGAWSATPIAALPGGANSQLGINPLLDLNIGKVTPIHPQTTPNHFLLCNFHSFIEDSSLIIQ